MDKRLFRNEHEKVIAGVSSGIAEYMEVDVTIIRLLFVLSTIFLVGIGVVVYIVVWIVAPVNYDPLSKFNKFNDFNQRHNNPFSPPNPFSQPQNPNPPTGGSGSGTTGQSWTSSTMNDGRFSTADKSRNFKSFPKNNDTGRTVGGLFLLVIGFYFLLNQFDVIPFWFNIGKLWPLVFVAVGVSILLKSKEKNAWEEWKRKNEQDNSETPSPVNDAVTPAGPVAPVSDSTVQPATEQAPKIDDRFTKKDI